MAAAGAGQKQLYECPTNVKEALEWLEAFGPGASQCAQVIKEKNIIKDFKDDENQAKKLCDAANAFLTAIKNGGSTQKTYKDATWSQLCTTQGSGKCCGKGGSGGCSNCSDPSKCNGCCKDCPKQICARIFCLIVPVLCEVLKFLYAKCNYGNANQKGDWASQKLDGTNGGKNKTDLKEFMVACGFDADKLNSASGGQLTNPGSIGALTPLASSIFELNKELYKALEQHDASKQFLKDASKPNLVTPAAKSPNSICDLLLWLQFLPYSTDYKKVNDELKKHIPDSVKIKGQTIDTLLKGFTSSIPMLFLFIEGKGKEDGSKSNSIFQHIDTLSKCQYYYEDKYYKKPEDVVKMLVSAMPVLYWSVDQMKDKCTESQCTSSVKDCKEVSGLLSSLGWNGTEENPSVSGNMKCSLFKDYIKKELIGDSEKGRLNEIKTAIENAWKGTNGAAAASSGSSASSGSHLPRTIYEMLIWLMGLPVSDKFKEFKTKLNSEFDKIKNDFTKILFEVPNLFLTLNGDMYTFHGIGNDTSPDKQFQYGSDGQSCLGIFSAIVAILYPVIRYLQQRCKGDAQAFANGESWVNINTNAGALKTFLEFMGFGPTIANSDKNGQGFHSDVLKKIFGDLTQNGGNEKLKQLYDVAKKKLEGESSKGTTPPTTIRQMMLWIIGLPVTTQYNGGSNGLMQTVTQKASSITDLKTKITGTGHDSFQKQLQHSIVGMMTVISQIEGGLGSVVEFLQKGFQDGSNKFKYGSNDELFTQFTTYVTSVHTQLRFLKVMCKTGKDHGGWSECTYANGQCTCTGNVASCLKDFLQSGDSGSGANGNKFKLYQSGESKQTECLQMGFKAYDPQNNNQITGDNISTYLEQLLDDIPTPPTQTTATVEFKKPLSLLTQYCVAIGPVEPSSLGDHFDVFRELAGGMWSKIEQKVKESLQNITKADTDGETAATALKEALKAVWPTGHNGQHDGDLRSLTGCNGSACTPFIATLSHGLYQYFIPKMEGQPQPPSQAKTHIDWLYMKMSALYGKLTALKTEMTEKCECCPENNPSSKCNGITQCPNCLPLMYKMGLVFGDPSKFNGKKCRDLMDMMEKVLVATTSKLCIVFKSIDDKRFWPYLLFSAMVVKGKNDKLNGDMVLKTYTYALGDDMYKAYLKEKKKTDKTAAETNKTARDEALKCTCSPHQYNAPEEKKANPIIVTLTLYFKGEQITVIQLEVPFHGPAYNPLVRLYPRNLKSIVDWLLRIGQTRLGQENEGKSGIEEMCKTFWPEIEKCLKDENSKDEFKQLVQGVISLMGMVNQGKTEVEKEITEKLAEVKKNIQEKLNGGSDGFEKTFKKILQFKPDQYIDAVITDFGQKLSTLPGKNNNGNRSFECIAKSVTTCMEQSLDKIKDLAKTNKQLENTYHVTGIEDLNESIEPVENLTSIEDLKKLCNGFKDFHGAYDKVTKAFNSHLSTAQQNGAWSNINKCVEAFNELGQCVKELGELNGMSTATQMQDASKKLEELATKLEKVIQKLNGDEIKDLSEKVTEFINKLDGELKTKGMSELETALQLNDSKVNTIEILLKTYISNLLDQVKKKNDQNNTVCDIHLRVRNDFQQLSECLKVMCEVCSTGMKGFAKELKECVEKGKEHLEKLKETKGNLTKLETALKDFNEKSQHSEMNQLKSAISTIEQLLKDPYIYNPPIIVNTLINSQATSAMTNYLKQLPDLIRDRYVLQKWKDEPQAFCGVQRFENGIVKKSDITGITGVLKELLSDTYHNATEVTIHEFQVRALIYNFCHKEGMEKIGSGARLLYFVSHYVNRDQGTNTSSSELKWEKIKDKHELKRVVDDICGNSYLRYFAGHLRDSIGYHTLSNTLGALDKVKESLSNGGQEQPANWTEFKDLLKKDAMKQLHERLEALVDKLNREYIFEYPPFDWQKSCKRLTKNQDEAARKKRSTDAQASPSSPSTTCDLCTHSMAHIFVGFVPQMYRLFKMLREMTQKEKQSKSDTLLNADNVQDILTKTLKVAGFFDSEGWRLKLGSDDDEAGEAFDLNHEKTGTEVCKLLETIIGDKEPGALMAKDGASTADSLKPLDQLFKAVMQHFKEKRNEKRNKRIEQLKTAFEAEQQRTKSGLKFVAPPAPLPSTVRQVLFWLHEMDTKGDFYNAMLLHINTLCERSNIKSDIKKETILHVLKLSITQCLEVLATIEDPGRQNAQYYYELYTEEHYYAYPTVNISLFFYTFVEKLMGAFLELNFVCVQCEFRATEGGWKDCEIGKAHQGAYEVQGSVCCICHERKTVGTPIHAVTVSGSVVCPRPLSAFLFSDQKNQLRIPGDGSQRSVYMSKGTMPCGFKLKNKAITDAATKGDAPTPTPPSTSMTGSVLVEPLRKLVGGHVTGRHNDTSRRNDENNTLSTVIYLRDLLRYTLCLAVRPPWSMSENMAFFYRVTESWKNKKGVGGVGFTVAHHNGQLLDAIHAEIALFPGSFDGTKLTSAVERFAGIEDTEQHGTSNGAVSPSGTHQYDLKTLMGCQETNTPGTSTTGTTAQCSPFMFPLALDVYTHYDHKNSRAYLSWILNFAFGIYGQLRGLEEMIKEKQCVRNNTSQSTPQCPSLPMCPGVLTALYQSGSSFMDQKVLSDVNKTHTGSTNTTKKMCNEFHSVLTGLFNCDPNGCSPLHNLIVQCEAFLWSIRLPFSLVQLSLWSVAILFISYVFVVPLDHFKIKSHLFNRLKYTMHPSLLIADSQRRVSEVAYFSL